MAAMLRQHAEAEQARARRRRCIRELTVMQGDWDARAPAILILLRGGPCTSTGEIDFPSTRAIES
jgi:hypothetical protein